MRVLSTEEAEQAVRELEAKQHRQDKCVPHHFGRTPYRAFSTIDCEKCGEQFTMEEARQYTKGFEAAMAVSEIIWPGLG